MRPLHPTPSVPQVYWEFAHTGMDMGRTARGRTRMIAALTGDCLPSMGRADVARCKLGVLMHPLTLCSAPAAHTPATLILTQRLT